ncbi:hypothetical protein AX17_002299 [Amanita inopinata Kibby_2008]|nr:hypothetical protein AX17_002299 [Amanita inopinata Kibby_2008]
MFQAALRAARPAGLVARPALKSPRINAIRALSSTSRVASDGPPPPQLIGPGGKPGEVPSDYEQMTGLARLQLLGELEGVNIFDDSPLDSSRIGTKTNPVLVQSYDVERIVGCTGFPADSHDITWFTLKKDKQARCTECGSVYALDFHGEEHADAHHH